MDAGSPAQQTVALALAYEAGWARAIARGVATAVAQRRLAWVLHSIAPTPESLEQLRRLRPAGLIVAVTSAGQARQCMELRRSCGTAVVNVGWLLPRLRLPHVGNDDLAIGRAAAEHLLADCGLRHLGFCGDTDTRVSSLRFKGFAQAAREVGCGVRAYRLPAAAARRPNASRALGTWLRGLAKPAGVLGASDNVARLVTDAARAAGLAVPQQIAVVGVDNDATICQLSTPPLSSVAVAMERIGSESARLLADMIEGGPRSGHRLFVPPLGVVRRQSSDMTAVDDTYLTAALRWIRLNAHRDVSVDDLVAAVPLSRSVLQRRFRAVLGRTPGAELRRTRLSLAKRLLADTDLKLTDVARRAGFSRVEYLHDVFRREVGMTMLSYRTQLRPRGSAGDDA